MIRVIVSGVIANKPFNGGEAWVRLSWVRGLERLGAEVFFVEQLHATSEESVQPRDWHNAPAVRYFQQVVKTFGIESRAALILDDGKSVCGVSNEGLQAAVESSSLIINISGNLKLRSLIDQIPIKLYIDLDPGFTQLWHEQGQLGTQLEGYDFYYTVGENIGTSASSIPTNGINWRPLRQPVLLDDFQPTPPAEPWRFTTVASWRGAYGPVHVGERQYGIKAHEFRKFATLPTLIEPRCEIALDIHPGETKDLQMLQQNRWTLVDPAQATGDPLKFREYVQQSGAEFSVAQGIYVETGSGWFSDRSVRYLACGKPALLQNTGFTRNLPVGEGLLAFNSLDEAVAGASSIASAYDKHSKAARRIAVEYFDSDKVIRSLLQDVGVNL
jgi:hypothetical protein